MNWNPVSCVIVRHLEVVVLVRVFRQQVFGALDVVGQLRLGQVGPKLLQHLGRGLHRHGEVLDGLLEKFLRNCCFFFFFLLFLSHQRYFRVKC